MPEVVRDPTATPPIVHEVWRLHNNYNMHVGQSPERDGVIVFLHPKAWRDVLSWPDYYSVASMTYSDEGATYRMFGCRVILSREVDEWTAVLGLTAGHGLLQDPPRVYP